MGPIVTGTTFQRVKAAASAGIMVPLYTYPGETWDTVVETKNDHPDVPIVAIVNPASGPGGSRDSLTMSPV
ncbi:MAG TPA: spherulation-specific family 4 protein [Nitrososphaera sp.]